MNIVGSFLDEQYPQVSLVTLQVSVSELQVIRKVGPRI